MRAVWGRWGRGLVGRGEGCGRRPIQLRSLITFRAYSAGSGGRKYSGLEGRKTICTPYREAALSTSDGSLNSIILKIRNQNSEFRRPYPSLFHHQGRTFNVPPIIPEAP